MKNKGADIEESLKERFESWEQIYLHGADDMLWPDGCNLNLIRNHICYYKGQMEEAGYFPEIYYRETPPKVESRYMAGADGIRKHAAEALAVYLKDENYIYLAENAHRACRRDAERSGLENALRHAESLAEYIKNDSLVEMRRHEHMERYLDEFKTCREKLQELLDGGSAGKEELKIVQEQTGQLRFA